MSDDDQVEAGIDLEPEQLDQIEQLEARLAEQHRFALAELDKALRWMRAGASWLEVYQALSSARRELDQWRDGPETIGGTNGKKETQQNREAWGPQQGQAPQASQAPKTPPDSGDKVDT